MFWRANRSNGLRFALWYSKIINSKPENRIISHLPEIKICKYIYLEYRKYNCFIFFCSDFLGPLRRLQLSLTIRVALDFTGNQRKSPKGVIDGGGGNGIVLRCVWLIIVKHLIVLSNDAISDATIEGVTMYSTIVYSMIEFVGYSSFILYFLQLLSSELNMKQKTNILSNYFNIWYSLILIKNIILQNKSWYAKILKSKLIIMKSWIIWYLQKNQLHILEQLYCIFC